MKALNLNEEELLQVRGFIAKKNYPEPLELKPVEFKEEQKIYLCHCGGCNHRKGIVGCGKPEIYFNRRNQAHQRLELVSVGQLCTDRLKSVMKKRRE